MAKFTEDDVRELAAAIKRRDSGVAFLTGAGCSVSAEIPLASQLVKEIKGKYAEEVKRLVKPELQEDYGSCMGALSLGERKELLEPYLLKAKINWANIALASLIQAKFVRRVLTFNFDSVLARACGLVACYPAIYDFGVSPSNRTDYLADPCIIHLHGQGYGPIMMNSEAETQAHAKKLRPLLDDTFARFPLVVIGYSGEADKVFGEIVEAYSGQYRIYWLGYDETPKGHLSKLREGQHRNLFHYVGGAEADAILIALAQKLDCFPPKAFSDPAGYLHDERAGIADFPLGPTGLKYDLLKQSQKRLKQHGESLKLDETSLAAFRGESEKIVAAERARPAGAKSAAPPEVTAWALIASGRAHVRKGQAENSPREFELAAADLERALVTEPQNADALHEWGVALLELARLKNDEAMYPEAIGKYEAALRARPEFPEALTSWGAALVFLAQLKNDETLYRQAIGKFEAALRARPEYPEALSGWGAALVGLAQLKKDEAMYREAIGKCETALQLKPEFPNPYRWQGTALAGLAALKRDPNLYREAIAKFEAALGAKRDYVEALDGLGGAWLDLWQVEKSAEQLDKARATLDRHEELDARHPYNRARLAAILGDEEGCRERLSRAKAAKTLPRPEVLKSEPSFAGLLEKPWFRELLGE